LSQKIYTFCDKITRQSFRKWKHVMIAYIQKRCISFAGIIILHFHNRRDILHSRATTNSGQYAALYTEKFRRIPHQINPNGNRICLENSFGSVFEIPGISSIKQNICAVCCFSMCMIKQHGIFPYYRSYDSI